MKTRPETSCRNAHLKTSSIQSETAEDGLACAANKKRLGAVYCLAFQLIACSFLIFNTFLRCPAQTGFPLCPLVAPKHPFPVVRLDDEVSIDKEVTRASAVAWSSSTTLMFEVQTNSAGDIRCVTPLRFTFSLFWRPAVEAIERELAGHNVPPSTQPRLFLLNFPGPRPQHKMEVITVPDLAHLPSNLGRDTYVDNLSCDTNDVDELLDRVRAFYASPQGRFEFDKPMQCVKAALTLAPDSWAVHYVAAVIYGGAAYSYPERSSERAELYREHLEQIQFVHSVMPDFLEAREQLAFTLEAMGNKAEAFPEIEVLAGPDMPLSFRIPATDQLAQIYENEGNRSRAKEEKRESEKLVKLSQSLEAFSKQEQEINLGIARERGSSH